MSKNDPNGLLQKCLSRLHPKEPIVLGFSGGGDSLALLHQLMTCANGTGRMVHAVIINHQMKPGADAQAELAAKMALDLGALPQILRWEGEALRGHAKARFARYELLAKACKRIGAAHLWLAHTADDQIETFLMRVSAGSGARGLAVMGFDAPYPLWPYGMGLRMLRPFLGNFRADLRDELRANKLSCLEDSANEDRQYQRVRLRQYLQALQDKGLHPIHALKPIKKLQQLATLEQKAVQDLMAEAVVFSPWGFAEINVDRLGQVCSLVLTRLLEKTMLAVSGNSWCKHSGEKVLLLLNHPPDRADILTINGCLIQRTDQRLLVFRDPGAVCGRQNQAQIIQQTKTNETTIFDNRWHIKLPVCGDIVAVGKHLEALTLKQRDFLKSVPYYAQASLPVFRAKTGKYSLLSQTFSQQVKFIGMIRGMETGTSFA